MKDEKITPMIEESFTIKQIGEPVPLVKVCMKAVKRVRVVFESDESPSKNEKNPVILVTGTPGTGKSSIISRMREECPSMQSLNISQMVKDEELHDGYDAEFDTYLINDRKTRKALLKNIPKLSKKGPLLIECHSCGLFDDDDLEPLIDRVLILTCSTESLYDRLQARKYSKKKINENMECEIMRVCADEAAEVFRMAASDDIIKEFQNDNETDQKKLIEYIKTLIIN